MSDYGTTKTEPEAKDFAAVDTPQTKTIEPSYLGDGVYAKFDGYGVVLTTNSHLDADARNRIVLEPEIFSALVEFGRAAFRKPQADEVPYDPANRHVKTFLTTINEYENGKQRAKENLARVAHVLPLLSESATINPYGGSVWFTVNNREDVQVLMQLAPRWEKEPAYSGTGIDYIDPVGGFRIQTIEGALPPTCRLVEEDVVIPARPERIEKKLVLKCAKPEGATS